MSKMDNDIVVGLLFGDEGKGATVDFLTSQRRTNAVVRFSGGAQAAHNVVTPDGRQHTFEEFGSGSFHGVRTILSRKVLVNPFNLVNEGVHLMPKVGWNVFEPLLVSGSALMNTPIHAAVNKQRERLRGANAHGSCGIGVGETQFYANVAGVDAPVMADLYDLDTLFVKLRKLAVWASEQVGDVSDLMPSLDELFASYKALSEDRIITVVDDARISEEMALGYNVFEGSQGVLLDENLGFHPHTTWSTTTQVNAQALLADAGLERGNVIGAVRSYLTRHGHGPFPSETMSGWESDYPEHHNGYGEFQGSWRVGVMDLPLLSYAVRANGGVDSLAVSHLDTPTREVVTGYEHFPFIPTDFYDKDRVKQEEVTNLLTSLTGKGQRLQVGEQELLGLLSATASAPVGIKSYGMSYKDRVQV